MNAAWFLSSFSLNTVRACVRVLCVDACVCMPSILSFPPPQTSPLTELEGRVEALGQTLVNLDRFLRINQEGLRKIAKKYDKVVADGSQMQRWVLARLRTQKFIKLQTSQLLVPLSTCHSILRRLREGAKGSDADKVWKPPESFQRKTTK